MGRGRGRSGSALDVLATGNKASQLNPRGQGRKEGDEEKCVNTPANVVF